MRNLNHCFFLMPLILPLHLTGNPDISILIMNIFFGIIQSVIYHHILN